MNKKLLAILCVSALSTAAVAQDDRGSGNGWQYSPEFSIGGGYGLTKLKDGDFDEEEAAKKAFAVFKINEFIGIEAAYIDFDESGNEAFDIDIKGKTLDLILELPISQSFSIYAKGGQMWWDADTNIDTSEFITSSDSDGDETFWGVGTKFRLAEHLDLRVEYERFNFEISRDEINVLQPDDIDMDVDYASVSLQFTF
ncbi:MAG TPA: porin family protein [Cellvibrio sp.]